MTVGKRPTPGPRATGEKVYVAMTMSLMSPAMEDWRQNVTKQGPGRVVEIRITVDSVEKEFTLEDFKERLGF